MTSTRIAKFPLTAVLGLVFSALLSASPAFANTPSPVYIHMNGLNDFLPKVTFVRPGEPVVFVNQDQGAHSIHGYLPVGGKHVKSMDEMSLAGTPGPGHTVHTYKVTFHHVGVHYYICTIHAHLVSVYKTPSGQNYYLPAKRKGIPGYRGSMAGTIVVTKEKNLLESNPSIVHKRILAKFWNNGDVSGH